MELEYLQKGDFLFPNIAMDAPIGDIGKYGSLRRTFLKEHCKGRYSGLLLSGKLWAHLVHTNERAKAQMDHIMSDMAAKQGVTEELKAQDPMEWVRRMNSLIASAEEIVLSELVYS